MVFVLRIGAIGALAASLMFVGIGVLLLPFGLADIVEEILMAGSSLSPLVLERYLARVPMYFVLDNTLVLGWLIAWVSLAALVRSRDPMWGNVLLVVGLFGPMFDFLENGISWVLIEGYRNNITMPTGWLLAWRLARFFSYMISYAGSALAAGGLWSKKPLDRFVAIVGSFLVVAAIAGFHLPALSMLVYVWWLVWFICLAWLLWRRAVEWPSEDLKSDSRMG